MVSQFSYCSLIVWMLSKIVTYILYATNEGAPPSRDSEGQQRATADDANVNPRFPSPEVLASVIERAQQLLSGSASSALSVCYFSSVSVLCTFYLAMLINQQMIYLDTLRLISCSSKMFASLVIFCISLNLLFWGGGCEHISILTSLWVIVFLSILWESI